MVVTIGNSILPGVLTTVESGDTRAVQSESPGTVALVGEANLSEGDAEANRVYPVSTSPQARRRFGAGSVLANQIEDGLGEGGLPILGIAPQPQTVSDEAVDDNTFANVPVTEDASSVAFTDDAATEYEARVVYGDPANAPDDAGVIYYNPVRGLIQQQQDVTGLTVSYEYHDWETAMESLASQRGEDVDFIVPLTEAEAVVQEAHDTVRAMEQRYELAMVFAGAPNQMDASVYDEASDPAPESIQANVNYDSSRMQQLHPSRESDGSIIMGAYGGRRAAIGINTSIMGKRLHTQKDLMVTLTRQQKEDLATNTIVPVADESRGARVVDDVTMVADDNQGESAMRYSLNRLVIDYVIDVENANSERFIGELNKKSTRDSLQDVITSELADLLKADALESYTVYVYEIDAVTAGMQLGIDTVDPLRNIDVLITAGEVQDVADQASGLETGGFA